MTCAELWDTVRHLDAPNCTRALRAAVIGHLHRCAPCSAKLDREADAEEAADPKMAAAATSLASSQIEADLDDPEFREAAGLPELEDYP